MDGKLECVGKIMGQSIIKLESVSKKYKKRTLFTDLELIVKPGTSVGIAGENGTGKSVLLKLIAGLALPDSGSVYVQDKRVGGKFGFPEEVGVLINTPYFCENETAIENLKFLAEINGKIGEQDIVQTLHLLKFDDITANIPMKDFSVGMRKKVAIAQAIMEKQKIIILDEPFNGVDKNSHFMILECLKKIKEENRTIILTSHNKKDLLQLCDEIYLLENGKLSRVYPV